MTTNIVNLLMNSSIYKKMLEQVPEDERDQALKELAEEVEPLGAILLSTPGAMDIFTSMLSNQEDVEAKNEPQPARRPPRRF
jgi:hypothetical protein